MLKTFKYLLSLILIISVSSVWATEKPAPAKDGNAPGFTALPPQTAPQASSQSEQVPSAAVKAIPALIGGGGLFGMWTAVPLLPWNFAISMHGEYFKYSDFLISNQNETNERMAGAIHWIMGLPNNFEVFASFYSSSNLNERDHLTPTYEPKIQMSLGDILFGVKYTHEINKFFNLGAVVSGRVYSGVASVTPDFAATSVGAHVIGTLLGDRMLPGSAVPFRVHFNLGYIYDNSKDLLEDAPLSDNFNTLEPLYAYMVKEFAFGISQSRVHFSLGLEFPFKVSDFTISPILEYHLNYYTDGADENILTWEDRVEVEGNLAADAALGQQLNAGLRTALTSNLTLDMGVNVALTHPGYAVAPSYPVYNVFAALSYNMPSGTSSASCKPVEVIKYQTKIQYVEKKQEDKSGIINGKVTDKKGNPLRAAIVSFIGIGKTDLSTDEAGGFSSYKLKPGKYKIKVSKKGYNPAVITTEVKAKDVSAVTVKLEKKMPKFCKIKVSVKSLKGKPLEASVKATGKSLEGKNVLIEETTASDNGEAVLKIQPGAYQIIFSKKRYLSKSKTITMTTCEDNTIQIQLRKKPRRSVARLNKRRKRITIRRRILFKYNSAILRGASKRILDEVASILIEHPEILKLRIEGHTDNKGSSSYNMKLSQKRAEAVKRYLVAQGVSASRLVAKGYGRTRPRYANISERLRRKNRRVEFKILQQK